MNYQITNILKSDKSYFPQSTLQVTITKISQATESLPCKGSLHWGNTETEQSNRSRLFDLIMQSPALYEMLQQLAQLHPTAYLSAGVLVLPITRSGKTLKFLKIVQTSCKIHCL